MYRSRGWNRSASLFTQLSATSYIKLKTLVSISEGSRIKSSLIRQKGESQNGCFNRTKHVKFFEKKNISYLLIRTCTCAYQVVKIVCFFGKFGVLCFLETPVLRFALFALLPTKCSLEKDSPRFLEYSDI